MDRDLFAQIETPERVSHRYHLVRVNFTLSTIGIITLVLGCGALVDPENIYPVRYFAGCFLVAAVCGLAVLYLKKWSSDSTSTVEGAMLAGLIATYANTIYGGLIGVDPWWQVCGYLAVILIAAGVSLRTWSTYCLFALLGLGAWIIAIGTADESAEFLFDSFVLILLGMVVGAAILWLFRIERKRVTELNRELRENASHDPLTGVLNRHGLLSALRQTGKLGGQAWCVYVDVDHFKPINDQHGHDHGDEVLRAAAVALYQSGGELAARWGGDEFVAIGFDQPPTVEEIQEDVQDGIRTVQPGASVTVGLAVGPTRSRKELDDLIRRADRQMYERRAIARGELPSSSS